MRRYTKITSDMICRELTLLLRWQFPRVSYSSILARIEIEYNYGQDQLLLSFYNRQISLPTDVDCLLEYFSERYLIPALPELTGLPAWAVAMKSGLFLGPWP